MQGSRDKTMDHKLPSSSMLKSKNGLVVGEDWCLNLCHCPVPPWHNVKFILCMFPIVMQV